MAVSRLRLPLIVADLDGVTVFKLHPMPRVKEAMQFLRRPLAEINPQKFAGAQLSLPFCLLTNRSAITEKTLCTVFNEAYQENLVAEHHMITCCTPLREIYAQYEKKLILIVGRFNTQLQRERIGEYLKEHNVTHFITSEEYCYLYPQIVPLSSQTRDSKQLQQDTLEEVSQRIGLSKEEILSQYLQVHAIFIIQRPASWEENLQLILDLLSTEDGRIAQKMPEKGPATHIPVFATFNDLMYKDEFVLPRMMIKPFTESLKLLHQQLYKTELQVQLFGKPEASQFQYTEHHARKHLLPANDEVEISNIYMIGDNVETDIVGANQAGWTSILVKTGVFQGQTNDVAKHVVNDFNDAIKLILQLENIETELTF